MSYGAPALTAVNSGATQATTSPDAAQPTTRRPSSSFSDKKACSKAVIGTCVSCKRERVPLNRHTLYCLERCYPEKLAARRVGPTARSKRTGDELLVNLFERHLGEAAAACMTEIAATVAGKYIYPNAAQYYDPPPTHPSTTQMLCSIVAKYDKERRLLPALRETFPAGMVYIPRRLGAFREFVPTSSPASFTLTDYLQPGTAEAMKALHDLTQQMNHYARKVLVPSEMMLAVTLYHANVAQLQKPSVSTLFEVFRRVLLIAQGLRIQEQATLRFEETPTKTLTSAEVQKLTGLLKAERDLMGEIGGSPRAAKRLGLTSGDALSALIERAPRPGHTLDTGQGFDAARELEQAQRVLALEATTGTDADMVGTEPMPEAEVEEALAAALDELERDA